ncbi:MAG: glycogen-binding domain-containing protein [Gemmatimonadetes bacterium]|nr:glycogen-binding domain-containing protein [Gemmatimonadota bacterium]
MRFLALTPVTCPEALRGATLCLGVLVAATSPAVGQRASLFAGGAHARYADSVSGTAASLGGELSLTGANAAGSGEVNYSQFTTGEWGVDLSFSGFAVRSDAEPVILGLSFGGRFSDFEGGTWSGEGVVGPFAAKTFGEVMTSLGITVGGVRRVDETSLATARAGLMAQYALPSGTTLDGGLTGTTADTIQYVDFTAGARFIWEGTALAVSVGARAGDLSDDPWIQASVETRLTRQATFEAALGRYPRSLEGLTDGVYASAGVRFHIGSSPRPPVGRPRRPLVVEPLGGGQLRVSITYDEPVERLEIAGDWNDWVPLPLIRGRAGRWSFEVRLDPGIYKFSIVVNGSEWTVPEGVATVPDDFGGTAGLLVVR